MASALAYLPCSYSHRNATSHTLLPRRSNLAQGTMVLPGVRVTKTILPTACWRSDVTTPHRGGELSKSIAWLACLIHGGEGFRHGCGDVGDGAHDSIAAAALCGFFDFRFEGFDEGFDAATPPRRLWSDGTEAPGEQAEHGGVRTGGGQPDADARSTFYHAGGDLDQAKA